MKQPLALFNGKHTHRLYRIVPEQDEKGPFFRVQAICDNGWSDVGIDCDSQADARAEADRFDLASYYELLERNPGL